MINPGLAPEASLGGVGRYAVFLGAFLSIFIRSGVFNRTLEATKIGLITVGLGTFFLIHSVLFSQVPDVSVLKVISWTLVTLTLLSAWSGLTCVERERLFESIYFGLALIMIFSLPLFFTPLGYLRNGSGFQGVLNHPQTLGPAMAILGSIAGSKLFSEERTSISTFVIFALSFFLILSSEARTAGLALVIGLCVALILLPLLTGRRMRSVLPGLKSKRLWGGAALVMVLSIIFLPNIAQVVDHYFTKSGRAGSVENIVDAYDQSRGALIGQMLSNINEYPLTGIGFGVASNPDEIEVQRDPLFGLPVGAPVEKGVLPIAVIEELGLGGGLLVFGWLCIVFRRSFKNGLLAVSVLSTCLLINLGENVLFSPGGMGLLVLVFITWAASYPRDSKPNYDKAVVHRDFTGR